MIAGNLYNLIKVKFDIKISYNNGNVVYGIIKEEIINEFAYAGGPKKIMNLKLENNFLEGIYNVRCNFSSDYPYKDDFHKAMKTQLGGVFQVLE